MKRFSSCGNKPKSLPIGVLVILLIGFVLIGFASSCFAQRHSADCWLERNSNYFPSYEGFTGAVGTPDDATLATKMQFLAHKYNVPYEVIAAVVDYESFGGHQFRGAVQPNGKYFVTHNQQECKNAFNSGYVDVQGNRPPCGIGLMQITKDTVAGVQTNGKPTIQDLISQWDVNLDAGVNWLSQKYDAAAQGDLPFLNGRKTDQARKIVENWFYALQYFNGTNPACSDTLCYPRAIFSALRFPAAGSLLDRLHIQIPVVDPSSAIPGFADRNGFLVEVTGSITVPSTGEFVGRWTYDDGSTRQYAAHISSKALVLNGTVSVHAKYKGTGAAATSAGVSFDGQATTTTDSQGNATLNNGSALSGLHFVQIRRSISDFFQAFINFVSGGAQQKGLQRTAAQIASPSSVTPVELESTASCSDLLPLGNFAVGDIVEVFGTGDGLRARYPDPCSDSYAVMPDLSAGTIVGAPQCCNGYIRWKIRYDGLSGIDVWSAEGEPSTGQLFLRKKQNSTCSYSLAPSRLDLDTSGAAASGFNVNTNSSCYWNAVSSQSWVSITTNGSGSGPKQVTFSVSANDSVNSRNGTVTVADQTFVITQPGTAAPTPTPTPTPGALALSTNSVFVGRQAGGGNVLVYNHASGSINWSATSDSSWLVVTTPSGSANANGSSLSFTVDQNSGGPQRVGNITVTSPGATGSPQTLAVTQGGLNGASMSITDIFAPSTANAGTNITVSWNQTSPINQQVLFELTFYLTNQSGVKYDITNDYFFMTVPAGSSQAGMGWNLPTNMYTGQYDTQISAWSDTNGDGVISQGDTLLGLLRKPATTYINGVALPPPPKPTLSLSTTQISVGFDSGGANLLVTNSGDGTLNWSATSGDNWITLELFSGSAAAGASNPLSFTFTPNNSSVSRSATITVADSSANGSPQSITVSQLGKLQVTSVGRPSPNTFALSWTADPARTYSILRSSDISFITYDVIVSGVSGSNPTFTDTTLPPNTKTMFYKVRLDP